MNLLSFVPPARLRGNVPGPAADIDVASFYLPTADGAAAPPADAPLESAEPDPQPEPARVAVSVGLRLSLEADLIAAALFHTSLLQSGIAPPIEDLEALFAALPSRTREAYRSAAEIAIQRLDQAVHDQAVAKAEAIVPGFAEGLAIYQVALTRGPLPAPSSVRRSS